MSEPLGNGMDTSIQLRNGDKEVLNLVDATVDAALAQGDITPAVSFGRALRRQMQASGLALAKLLYRIYESWDLFQSSGIEDEFVDVIYSEMGVAPGTTKKYVALWSALFANPQIPAEVKENLESKPIRSLILLTASARDEDMDWERVVDAATPAEIREIVREHRGQQTSSGSALLLQIDLRDGKLYATKNNETVAIGVLNVKNYKNDAITAQAIDRIIDAAGILEK